MALKPFFIFSINYGNLYNNSMVYYINIVGCYFIIELVVDLLLLKIFKIKYSIWYVLLLQIPKVCASIVCISYPTNLYLCFGSKIASKFLCIFFITDSLSLKKMATIFLTNLILLFSIGGFIQFLLLFFNCSLYDIFKLKVSKYYTICTIFLIFLYVFALFYTVRFIEKNRIIKKHLAKVSLNINGKHMSFYGLVDSGNSLFDPLTRKPVVLISLCSLSKFLSKTEIDEIMQRRCRMISCDTIAKSSFSIPIFEIKKMGLYFNEKTEFVNCFVGLVEKKFENGKFDCLLHRDFL